MDVVTRLQKLSKDGGMVFSAGALTAPSAAAAGGSGDAAAGAGAGVGGVAEAPAAAAVEGTGEVAKAVPALTPEMVNHTGLVWKGACWDMEVLYYQTTAREYEGVRDLVHLLEEVKVKPRESSIDVTATPTPPPAKPCC
jgi:hypothetical protein